MFFGMPLTFIVTHPNRRSPTNDPLVRQRKLPSKSSPTRKVNTFSIIRTSTTITFNGMGTSHFVGRLLWAPWVEFNRDSSVLYPVEQVTRHRNSKARTMLLKHVITNRVLTPLRNICGTRNHQHVRINIFNGILRNRTNVAFRRRIRSIRTLFRKFRWATIVLFFCR